jgi:hypothetical protein
MVTLDACLLGTYCWNQTNTANNKYLFGSIIVCVFLLYVVLLLHNDPPSRLAPYISNQPLLPPLFNTREGSFLGFMVTRYMASFPAER